MKKIIMLGVLFIMSNLKAYQLPKPTGRFHVGTKSYHWIDKSRSRFEGVALEKYVPFETSQAEIDDHPQRELNIQVWYPAQADDDAKKAAYDEAAARLWTQWCKTKGDTSSQAQEYFDNLQTNSIVDAPLSDAQQEYPIIICSHGYTVQRCVHASLCEELASHGYIVFAIEHTGTSVLTELPDGRTVGCAFPTVSGICQQLVEMRVKDVKFLLNTLENLDEKNMLYERLDLDKVGIFGHSMGGMTAVHASMQDQRIKAGACVEGPVLSADYFPEKGEKKPFLFLFAETFDEKFGNQEMLDFFGMQQPEFVPTYKKFVENFTSDCFEVTIKGTHHGDFCDAALYKKHVTVINDEFEMGVIDGEYLTQINRNYLVDFFNTFLLQQKEALSVLDYPEVVIKKI